jgi:hypothetical protein
MQKAGKLVPVQKARILVTNAKSKEINTLWKKQGT